MMLLRLKLLRIVSCFLWPAPPVMTLAPCLAVGTRVPAPTRSKLTRGSLCIGITPLFLGGHAVGLGMIGQVTPSTFPCRLALSHTRSCTRNHRKYRRVRHYTDAC